MKCLGRCGLGSRLLGALSSRAPSDGRARAGGGERVERAGRPTLRAGSHPPVQARIPPLTVPLPHLLPQARLLADSQF